MQLFFLHLYSWLVVNNFHDQPPWLNLLYCCVPSLTNLPFPHKLAKQHAPTLQNGTSSPHLPTPLQLLDHKNRQMYVYNFAGNKFSKVHGTFVSRACRLIYSNDKSISHCNSRFVNAFVVEKKIYILFGFSYVLVARHHSIRTY